MNIDLKLKSMLKTDGVQEKFLLIGKTRVILDKINLNLLHSMRFNVNVKKAFGIMNLSSIIKRSIM